MRLFVEIQRRGLLKLATGYLIVSWLVLEVGHTLFNVFELPHAALQFVFVLLALGFPLVMLGAWQGWFGSTPRSDPHAAQEGGGEHASISHHEGPWLAAVFGAVALFAIAVAIGVRFFGMGHSGSRTEHESAAAPVTAAPISAKATAEPALPTAASVSDKSIAVLPFTDMSEKKDQEYFADGMAEEVIDILAKIPGLNVIGRTSSFRFKGKSEDLRTIGAQLGTAFVVEGSVRMAGARVRVTAQLIDTRSGAHRWSESYDRDFGDILALQNEIGTGIARSLQLMVDADARPRPQLPNADAYTIYLHGLELRDQQHLDQLVQAAQEFEQALALDPSFLRAAEALAVTHVALGFDDDLIAHDAWQHARVSAEAALRIDPNSAPAHGVLGLMHAEDEFDWSAADAEFHKALALNPRDSVTLDYAAIVASARGQFEEAQRLSNASLALDPLNPYAQQKLGQMHFAMGDFAGAEAAFRKSITINATFDGNHYFLGRMLIARGQIEAARKEMQAEVASDAKDAGLAMVYHALGRKVESDEALARLIQASGDTWPYSVATVHANRGERDEAFEWLEKARAARDSDLLEGIRGDPEFAALRHDPRYRELLRKMNLPET